MIQVITNALVSAAGYLLVGIGFLLIYNTVRFFHLAHGIVLTIGAYVTFSLKIYGGLSLPLAMSGGAIVGALTGVIVETWIYRPMRNRGASSAGLLLASLGVYIVLQSFLSIIFSSRTQTFREGVLPENIVLFGVHLTSARIALLGASPLCCILVWLFLDNTMMGKAIRATASDPELAEVSGINREQIILIVFIVGSALASMTGALLAWDADMTPFMGFRLLLMGIIAVILGGIGSVPGAALGALLLGLVQHLTAWWISSTWQDTVLFLILLICLVVMPQGLLGRSSQKGFV